MANGYEVITSGTFDGSTKSLTLSSITQAYTHLQFDFMGSNDQASVSGGYLYFKFNGDTTAVYDRFLDYKSGSSAVTYDFSENSTAPTGVVQSTGATSNANQASQLRVRIFDYTNTTTNKVCMVDAVNPDITYPYSGGWGTKMSMANGVLNYAPGTAAAITEIYFSAEYAPAILSGSTYRLGGWT